jgi:hypothetical protein
MFPHSPIPRPEYPRPDRQRGRVEGVEWLNLNGPWQFRFDPPRHGAQERWFEPGGPDWREQIIVPFCWESLAAWGEGDAAGNDNYYSKRVFLDPVGVTSDNHRQAPRHEVGWYRRRVLLPDAPAWRERRVYLTIGAADFFTDVWCNGVQVGHHEGGYNPIELDLTDALRPASAPAGAAGAETGAEAFLVIRVEDPMNNCEQPVGKQWGWYTTTSGIWQTVFLEPRSAVHIDHFRIVSDIDTARVSFEVVGRGLGTEHAVSVEILPPEGPPLHCVLSPAPGDAGASLHLGEAGLALVVLWDPGDPKLYRVLFRVHDAAGRELDLVRGYFGMRKIGTAPVGDEPAMLCLNNKPIYLRGALYQSYHPAGVYTAPDASVLRDDIGYARRMGFDFLRVHIKLDDPILLYYADTLGILVMQDFPNFGEGGDTPLGRRRFEEMMRRGMVRDFNHPSIIAWCIFNESWGFGGQNELMKLITPHLELPQRDREARRAASESAFEWIHQMWLLAKSLDPNRLVEDMSVVVWEHLDAYGHVDTDINSWHFYLDDYAKARAHIESVVAKTYRGSTFNYIEGRSQRDAPLINSEYGGVGALDGDRDISWSFKFLTNELRRHGQLSAYIFTELTDVEWEYNGFLNYDRTRKVFGYEPAIINQGDVLPIDCAPIVRADLGGRVEIAVFSSHFSRRPRREVELHWIYSGIDTLGTEHLALARGRAPIPFPHHRVELARRVEVGLPSEPMLCTFTVAAVTPAGETVASNFIQHLVGQHPPPEREERGPSLVLRRRVQDWHSAVWNLGHSTREEAEAAGTAFGQGAGHFEWWFTDRELRRLPQAVRIRLLIEVASHRLDTPQTDSHRYPTWCEFTLNGVPVHRGLLPDHPHDTRGALSYLRGARGGYGYLVRTVLEDTVLASVAAASGRDGILRFRCTVPDVSPIGGLTVFEHDCGRYPIAPTVIVEWPQG